MLYINSERINPAFQRTILIYFSISNTEMEISMQSYLHWIIEKGRTYSWQKPRLLGFSIAANYSRLMLQVFHYSDVLFRSFLYHGYETK